MENWRKRWGVAQWAAYFETKKLPVLARSKLLVSALEQEKGELLSPSDLSDVVLNDPLLCLLLLREAERLRSHRLGHETTTVLVAIMQLGLNEFRELLFSSDEVDATNSGVMEVESRTSLASRIALRWASGHMDINPAEVALAALLADTGELLLRVYEPELAQAAQDELSSGRAERSAQAQIRACGFDFKQLTIRCSEQWNLPSLLLQLLRGSESERAKLTRLCSSFARHLTHPDDNLELALRYDLAEVHKLIPSASIEWLVNEIPEIPAEMKPQLLG